MRNFILLTLMLSANAFAQAPAAPSPPKEPTPAETRLPPNVLTLPPLLPNLGGGYVVVLPVSGVCVIPLKTVPIPQDVEGKVVKPDVSTSRMPMAGGLPVCGASNASK